MKNKINIAKLLQDCPKGMELDCAMFNKVTLVEVDFDNCDYPISISANGDRYGLSRYGEWFYRDKNAKCVIFPKGKTTWEGFVPPVQFNDGDIVSTNDGNYIFILKGRIVKESDFYKGKTHFAFCKRDNKILDNNTPWFFNRLSTEEEKQRLFNAIKYSGYKWNAETKTLEKLIEPKFTRGDIIKNKNDKWQAKRTIKTYIRGIGYFTTINDWIRIDDQDEWELVPDKFDISTLKPFDKVLVRCRSLEKWSIQFFEKYDKTYQDPFVCLGSNKYKQCIPYEQNEHLLGTTNDCDEFYKTWRNRI